MATLRERRWNRYLGSDENRNGLQFGLAWGRAAQQEMRKPWWQGSQSMHHISPHHILQILGVFKCLNILNILNDVNLRRSSPAAWEGLGQDFQGGLDMSRPFEYLSCGSKSFLADLARSGQVFWPRSNSFKARCHAIASVSSNYKFAV